MQILRLLSVIGFASTQQLPPTFANKENNSISFNSSLRCGQCINGGFNFCYQGNSTLKKVQKLNSVCLQDDNSSSSLDSSWQCSKSYADSNAALTFCPQKKGEKHHDFSGQKNGTNKTFSLSGLKKGETFTFHLNSSQGAIAFAVKNHSKNSGLINVTYIEYSEKHLNSSKGKQRHLSSSNSSEIQEQDEKINCNFSDAGNQGLYNQKAPARLFDNGTQLESVSLGDRLAAKKKIYQNQTKKNNSWLNFNITGKVKDFYQSWFPKNNTASNQTLFLQKEYEGNSTKYAQGNDTHRKLNENEFNQRRNQSLNQQNKNINRTQNSMEKLNHTEKLSFEKKNQSESERNQSEKGGQKKLNQSELHNRQNYSSNFSFDNQTHAVIGYGVPTKGQYSLNRGGWKSFGTIGQGNSTLGVKDDADSSNEKRHVFITFTALQDFKDSDQISLIAQNSQFVDDAAKQ